ncbi:unnamed protein product [Clonostachys rosea]|uniref:Carrier domain-containing protein n=1 Tax=Bionectria ochroleuca TaxID=29856 RepID=A0ABY6TR11_BIOOC|nr:unnamed protein product [Clonostachys rosea]
MELYGYKEPVPLSNTPSGFDKACSNTNHELSHASEKHEINPLAAIVRSTVQSITGWGTLGEDDVFFDKGLDSLQALRITRALRRNMNRPAISMSVLYKNPTVRQLSEALFGVNSGQKQTGSLLTSLQSTYMDRVKSIRLSTSTTRRSRPCDIVLTGSTGYLGTYMLHSILSRSDVGHVFCLNRGEDGGRAVQLKRFAAASLHFTKEMESRVTFLKADLAHPKLGLDDKAYKSLTERVGIIIHNAWTVNFILGLQAFQPQLDGVVNLCSLAAASAPPLAKIVFISSVSAVISGDGRSAPEAIVTTPPESHQGYGQSKFISETILETAARHLGVPAIIARVGQIAGAVHQRGLWNPSEWLPSIVISSLYLGCLPDNLGVMEVIDWIPSDVLSEIIIDIATNTKEADSSRQGAQVFNLRNPRVTFWAELVPTILKTAKDLQGLEIELVRPNVWLQRLRASHTRLTAEGALNGLTASASKNPALKLLDFYSNSLWADGARARPMEVGNASPLSPTLKSLPTVDKAWMRKWVEEWAALVNS